ncbi:MAG: acyltransferase family protein [Nitrospirota bacterium]
MKTDNHTGRLYYIDWLRFIGVLIVFCFHVSMIFVSWNWHINNAESSFIMDTFVRFIHLWIMPMFFVLAGASSEYSLHVRTEGDYIRERFKRLIVPIIIGVLFLIPPQIYLERLSSAEFHGSYLQFYPHFFEGLYPGGNFTLNHIWFVLYLFVISIISLPLMKGLRRVRIIEKYRREKAWILFFLVAIVAIESIFRIVWPVYLYPADLMIFLVYFTFGHYMALDNTLRDIIKKHSNSAFLIGVIFFIALTAFYYRTWIPAPGHSWKYVAFQVFWSVTGWVWVVAILGLGMKKLNKRHVALGLVNEAVLPFYILHQTVILVIAYYAVQWKAGIFMTFLFILTSAFLITFILYLVIRQFDVMRVLFGLKRKADKTLKIERIPQDAFLARLILWLSN